ncbi:hypothetical protein Oscil6304_1083 [Oscillatoria acuminata PCC 6304]|uniref:Uncharacterized protein n=2 Tax=Oscillatoria acuminata TaxID=118323 RepID=K9TE68_9CYAN|nr:hypothetical protein Oscil6304_1083 [Oscillatoria acuminata PCC 6304]
MVEAVENYGEEPGDRSCLAGFKPLGIQKPFLPHQPLGQKPFEAQFLTPIARESLTSFELEPAIAYLASGEEEGESLNFEKIPNPPAPFPKREGGERDVFPPPLREEKRPNPPAPFPKREGGERDVFPPPLLGEGGRGERSDWVLDKIAIATQAGQTLGQWHSIGDRSTQRTPPSNSSFQLPLTLSVEEIAPNFSEQSALTPFASPPLDLGIATTTESMPTTWANLEDLLTQTAQIDTEGEFVLTPWGVQRDSPPEPQGDRSPVPAQHPPDYPDPRSREVTITAPGYGPTPEPENLEILARKVYDLIKQRLTIDRERNGGRYSRRSPW